MISVITTTYNCAEYILLAVRSILTQTYKEFEYIIIDDGSKDNTEDIISNIKDRRIKYFKTKHIGRSAVLNYALSMAKYDTIALMDADDISHPLRLEKQLDVFKNSDQFVFTDTAYFKENKIKYIIKSPGDRIEINKKLALHGHFNNSSSMFNKAHVVQNGGYNELLTAYEDYDLWLRIMKKSQFIVIPGVYHYMRLRADSMTTTNPSKLKDLIYLLQSNYYVDLSYQFGITDSDEQNILKGWREYFYGRKNRARNFWKHVNLIKRNPKVNLAYILSYLPENLLKFIINNRIRLRLVFLFRQVNENSKIQKEFNNLLQNLLDKQ